MANILSFPDSGQLGENDYFHSEKNGEDTKSTYKNIPVATKSSNGLMSSDDKKSIFLKEKGDANSLLQNGTYTIADTDMNNPSKTFCTLIVFDALNYTVQLLISHDATSVYIRTYYTVSLIWTTWKRITLTQNMQAAATNVLTETIFDQQRYNTQSFAPANTVPISEESDSYTQEFADTKIPDNTGFSANLDRLTRAVEHLSTKYPDDETLKQILESEVHTS